MRNPDLIDPDRPLDELTDDEAVAILEGRLPASDQPDDHQAALSIAQGLLEEVDQVENVHSARGASVVSLFTEQPWMKMAAALLLGFLVSTLVQTTDSDSHSVASGNVVDLDTFRGAGLPEVQLPTEESWISLIAYPDIATADQLRMRVEKSSAETAGVPIPRELEWTLILEQTTKAAVQSAIVINVESGLLRPGLHRLQIRSDTTGDEVGSAALFLVIEARH